MSFRHAKRPTLSFLLVLISVIAGTRASAQSPPRPHDLADIQTSGMLRIAITSYDVPAFRWRDGSDYVGPEADLARGLSNALGVTVVYVPEAGSFDEVVDLVAQGRADIAINKLSQTYARLKLVRFSEPYLTLRQAMLFNRAAVAAHAGGAAPEDSLRLFRGRIGAIRGTSYVDFARRNWPEATITEFPDWDTAIAALLGGTVDTLYRDEFEIRRTLQSRPTLNIYAGAAILTDEPDFLSIAICNTCQKLQELINFYIAQTRGLMTLRRLLAANQ